MSEDYDDLHSRIKVAVDKLGDLEEVDVGEGEGTQLQVPPETVRLLTSGLTASLAMAESSIGECQKAVPFSPMRPVFKEGSDEVEWCCNHNPPHCGGSGA